MSISGDTISLKCASGYCGGLVLSDSVAVGDTIKAEFSGTGGFAGLSCSFYKSDGTYIRNSGAELSTLTFTVPSETMYSVLCIGTTNNVAGTFTLTSLRKV